MAYRFGPVVVGVDGSEHSVGALRWAAEQAHQYTRTLIALSVLPESPSPPPGPSRDRDVAAEAAAEARRWRVGVAAVGTTEVGRPVAVLRRHARDARLLVVASRGTGGRALGSVTEALGVRADCPVLIVHDAQRWAAPDAVLPRKGPVVVGYDGSASARRALRVAFEEAAGRGSRLVVVRAWHHPDLWRPGRSRCCDLTSDEAAVRGGLHEAAAPWRARFPHVDVEVRGERGQAAEALTVVSQWAALMVLGTRCPDDTEQPANPSVMRRVLERAACPVLVAHSPPGGPGFR
ncbi:universal stress protein [Dactylosporangium fulvum]|uniref:universal stress protein n=1 Tax=Dactylosporangium fulvum TaxID=53359 RepID=UPI0031DCC8A5